MKLADYGELRGAEAALAEWIRAGNRERFVVSGSAPGADAAPGLRLRASFLRALALDAFEDCRVSEKGLRVAGAYIEGDGKEGAATRGLDLEGCTLRGDLGLIECHFPDLVLLRGAQMQSLFLSRSILARGLGADGLEARGGVFLRKVTATGEVRLLGARLGGDLTCAGATLTAGKGGKALSADGLEARGGVFLSNVTVTGEVRLLGAKLGGNVDCVGAHLEAGAGGDALSADGLEARGNFFLGGVTTIGEVRLLGAKLGGDLDCAGANFKARVGGVALTLSGAHIDGAFFLRVGAKVQGVLDLTTAEIGHINDDAACWPGPGNLILDRCRYGAFTGGPVDAASRLRWLALQDPETYGEDFWPQPYEECARVLREMGHQGAAREILIEKERLQRRARRAGFRRAYLFEDAYWFGFWDAVLGASVRYGRQPLFAFVWLFVLWAIGWGVFGYAASVGAIKPNLPQIQRSEEWVACNPDYEPDKEGPPYPLRNTKGCTHRQV